MFDTKVPLKPLLKQINDVFFRHVAFPSYLTGSLPKRDFVSNVSLHADARIVIMEDISAFFDCITAAHVYRIWHRFFGFGEEAARMLTALTTKDGRVFQGTPTSSFLANLVFWDIESAVVEKLGAQNDVVRPCRIVRRGGAA